MNLLDLPGPAHEGADEIARVIYASRSTLSCGIYEQMERIRASALRNNVPLGIHTALLYESGWFVQWKEGPAQAMRHMMDRVACDPRYTQLQVVHSSRGGRLLHDPWAMAFVQGLTTAADMLARIRKARTALEAGQQMRPLDAWLQLSAPFELGCDPESVPPHHRMSVCCARSDTSLDFVRFMARRYKQPVTQRRFAGMAGLDVASDYTDFISGGKAIRVVAMGRRSLSFSLTRAFLPDYDLNLVILNGDHQQHDSLVSRLAAAADPLRTKPQFVAVDLNVDELMRVKTLAACMGLHVRAALIDLREHLAIWRIARSLLGTCVPRGNDGAPVGLPRTGRLSIVKQANCRGSAQAWQL